MKKFLLCFSLVSLMFGCWNSSKEKEKIVLGLAISTLNNPFFVQLRDGAVRAAETANCELIVLDSQNDVAKELTNVEDLLSNKVQAILINPVDSDSSAKAAQLVKKAGIPIISLDRNLNGIAVTTHVASDNVAGGRMAAQYLQTLLPASSEILELEGIPGTSAARERGQGFEEEMQQAGYRIAAKQTANFDRSQGLTVTENLLQVHPDTKAIFAQNDEMALGAQRAATDAKKNIIIIGFDATPDALAAVENGTLSATIAQQPFLVGELGVKSALDVLSGQDVKSTIPVELLLIKKS